jgi:hypothetical protein
MPLFYVAIIYKTKFHFSRQRNSDLMDYKEMPDQIRRIFQQKWQQRMRRMLLVVSQNKQKL